MCIRDSFQTPNKPVSLNEFAKKEVLYEQERAEIAEEAQNNLAMQENKQQGQGEDAEINCPFTIESLWNLVDYSWICLLYTSPSPRDRQKSRMPSSA
eukprot:TRINITY_DN20398_c0_g1_i1.p1 TRINITY_DN20398_c0_g1~~TRINITY_DN20398_c0_g1_i1.p1  ORF type:complete len:107 (+),score=37.63 TRINITY_DN20398_c0_g1_i1:33-323(+)